MAKKNSRAVEKIEMENLKKTVINGKLKNCLIFTAENKNIIKRHSKYIAATFLCEKGGCLKCDTCKNILSEVHPDIVNIKEDEGKTEITIEKIRELKENISAFPAVGEHKFFIINKGQMMNANAQNALLKTLESPPKFCHIIILTNSCSALLETVVSRCMVYDFSSIRPENAKVLPRHAKDKAVVIYMVEQMGISETLLSDESFKVYEQAKKLYNSINKNIKILNVDLFLLYKTNTNKDIEKCFFILKAFLKIALDKERAKDYNGVDIICTKTKEQLMQVFDIIDEELKGLKTNVNANLASANLFKKICDVLK